MARRANARLVLAPEEGDGWVVPVTLDPPGELVERLHVGESLGWVGTLPPLTVAGSPLELPCVELAGADAVRRFTGRILVVPPATRVDDELARALVERAEAGASVLAIAAQDAPWVAVGGPVVPPPVEEALLVGVPRSAFDTWGREGTGWGKPLRIPEGNHVDLAPGYVRLCYPGQGVLIFAQVRVFEALDDEPLAATLLARLLDLAHRAPPPLSAPRTVTVVRGAMPPAIPRLFGTKLGEGPAVVVANGGNPASAIAQEDPPAVILADTSSLYLPARGMQTGPGLDAIEAERRPELLRFLTIAGLRVPSDRYWK